eukprot:scaffold1790_cov257-Pinguiococcus_pyrenoidosus.AAC.15
MRIACHPILAAPEPTYLSACRRCAGSPAPSGRWFRPSPPSPARSPAAAVSRCGWWSTHRKCPTPALSWAGAPGPDPPEWRPSRGPSSSSSWSPRPDPWRQAPKGHRPARHTCARTSACLAASTAATSLRPADFSKRAPRRRPPTALVADSGGAPAPPAVSEAGRARKLKTAPS